MSWNPIHGTKGPDLRRLNTGGSALQQVGGGQLFGSPPQEPYVPPTMNFAREDDDDDEEDEDEDDQDEDEEEEEDSYEPEPPRKKRKPTGNARPGMVDTNQPAYVAPTINWEDGGRDRVQNQSGRKSKGSRRTSGTPAVRPYVPPTINWRTDEIEFG
jgi:hypothetical protein